MKTSELCQTIVSGLKTTSIFLLTYDPRDLLDLDGEFGCRERTKRAGDRRVKRVKAYWQEVKMAWSNTRDKVAEVRTEAKRAIRVQVFRAIRLALVLRTMGRVGVEEARLALSAVPGPDGWTMVETSIGCSTPTEVKRTRKKARRRPAMANVAAQEIGYTPTVNVTPGHVPTVAELSELTVEQLRGMASLLNVTGHETFKKQTLIVAIRNESKKHADASVSDHS
jgi:hypothetical protein